MSASEYDKCLRFMESPEYRQSMVQNDLEVQVRTIETFLSTLDRREEVVSYYGGLSSLLNVYLFHSEIEAVQTTLNRMDAIVITPDTYPASLDIARYLFDKSNEWELTEKYLVRALDVPNQKRGHQARVYSLWLAVAVRKDPTSAQVQDLLLMLRNLIEETQFSPPFLFRSLCILIPMGLVPWWGRYLLEAYWASLAVRTRFDLPNLEGRAARRGLHLPNREDMAVQLASRMEEIEALHALLPAKPMSGSQDIPDEVTPDKTEK